MFHVEHSQQQKKQITKCSTWNIRNNRKSRLQNVPRGTWQHKASVMFHVEHSQPQKKQESHE